MTVATLLTAIALAGAIIAGVDRQLVMTGFIIAYGGLCLPMYSLCVAHTNDYLEADDIVGASGALVFAVGIGQRSVRW